MQEENHYEDSAPSPGLEKDINGNLKPLEHQFEDLKRGKQKLNHEEDPPKTDALSKKSDNSNEKGVVQKQANVQVEDQGDKVSKSNTFHE